MRGVLFFLFLLYLSLLTYSSSSIFLLIHSPLCPSLFLSSILLYPFFVLHVISVTTLSVTSSLISLSLQFSFTYFPICSILPYFLVVSCYSPLVIFRLLHPPPSLLCPSCYPPSVILPSTTPSSLPSTQATHLTTSPFPAPPLGSRVMPRRQ